MRSEHETLARRYRLGEVIGVGGMGTVVRGHDDVLDRPVAVKILKDELGVDEATVERFRREARIAAALSHPGIAHVFDFVEEDGRAFIVMELLDGEDLHRVLSRQGPIDPADAAGIVAQAADALDHAHAAGSVHRDVKPANIFWTRAGSVKVTDFGIASGRAYAPVTVTGAVFGTPHYLSPEQVRGERATPASDVYALGCVLYQMLTAHPPYEAETSIAIATAHLSEPVPDPRLVDPSVSEAIAAVTVRAMAKHPEDRYASAGAMAAALRQAGGAPTVPVPPPAGPGTMALQLDAPSSVPTPPAPAPFSPAFFEGSTAPGDQDRVPSAADLPSSSGGRRRATVAVALLAAIVLAVLAGAALLQRDREFVLPSWTGMPSEQAAAEAGRLGLRVSRTEEPAPRPPGEVVDQRPGPGTPMMEGDTVTLVVSLGDVVEVPDFVGKTVDEAKDRAGGAGLVLRFNRDGEDEDGVVTAQDPPPAALVPRGSVVTLTVTKKDEDVRGRRGKGRGGG